MKESLKDGKRIGSLAKQLGVQRFVIRFWEKEFDIAASRTKGGQRVYLHADIERFKKIKQLLYEEGFTIAGAKKCLDQGQSSAPSTQSTTPIPNSKDKKRPTPHTKDDLILIKEKLIAIKKLLR